MQLRRGAWVALASVAILAGVPDAHGGLLTQDACPQQPIVEAFAIVPGATLENLVFDGQGKLYVTDVFGGRLLRFAPDGSVETLLSEPGNEFTGLAMTPWGTLYMGAGFSMVGSAPGEVRWFTKLTPPVEYRVLASGWNASNGLAYSWSGNDLYVSPGFQQGIVLVPENNPEAWREFSPVYGANGLAIDEATHSLYAAITPDTGSKIVRMRTYDGTRVETVAQLAAGGATLQPATYPASLGLPLLPKTLDDLELDAAGRFLYVTGHLSNELLRVDLLTSQVCLLSDDVLQPSAVRIARGFGPHDGKLFVTEFTGRLVMLDL